MGAICQRVSPLSKSSRGMLFLNDIGQFRRHELLNLWEFLTLAFVGLAHDQTLSGL